MRFVNKRSAFITLPTVTSIYRSPAIAIDIYRSTSWKNISQGLLTSWTGTPKSNSYNFQSLAGVRPKLIKYSARYMYWFVVEGIRYSLQAECNFLCIFFDVTFCINRTCVNRNRVKKNPFFPVSQFVQKKSYFYIKQKCLITTSLDRHFILKGIPYLMTRFFSLNLLPIYLYCSGFKENFNFLPKVMLE